METKIDCGLKLRNPGLETGMYQFNNDIKPGECIEVGGGFFGFLFGTTRYYSKSSLKAVHVDQGSYSASCGPEAYAETLDGEIIYGNVVPCPE